MSFAKGDAASASRTLFLMDWRAGRGAQARDKDECTWVVPGAGGEEVRAMGRRAHRNISDTRCLHGHYTCDPPSRKRRRARGGARGRVGHVRRSTFIGAGVNRAAAIQETAAMIISGGGHGPTHRLLGFFSLSMSFMILAATSATWTSSGQATKSVPCRRGPWARRERLATARGCCCYGKMASAPCHRR